MGTHHIAVLLYTHTGKHEQTQHNEMAIKTNTGTLGAILRDKRIIGEGWPYGTQPLKKYSEIISPEVVGTVKKGEP